MTFPSLNAYTVIFEEGKKAQMNHLQEMVGEKECGWHGRWLSVWAHSCLCCSSRHALETSPLEAYIHSRVGAASAFRYQHVNLHPLGFSEDAQAQVAILSCPWSFDIRPSRHKVINDFNSWKQNSSCHLVLFFFSSSRKWSKCVGIPPVLRCQLPDLIRGWQTLL